MAFSWPDHASSVHLGVLMLNTNFPRLNGDIGNPATFPFRVDHKVIESATPDSIVRSDGPAPFVRADFIDGASSLVENGATVITTSCGFLCVCQDEFADALPVPVVTSSLTMLPSLAHEHGRDRPIGILTFDGPTLSKMKLPDGTGPVVIQGLEDGDELFPVISRDGLELDPAMAERDAIKAARALKARAPDMVAVVIECTNLPPYRSVIEKEVGVPVYDFRDAIAKAMPSSSPIS